MDSQETKDKEAWLLAWAKMARAAGMDELLIWTLVTDTAGKDGRS